LDCVPILRRWRDDQQENSSDEFCQLDSLSVSKQSLGMAGGLKLEELAARAGVSVRTVRYYIQRGLLPAPEFRGPDTNYDEQHLLALRAIRNLQEAYLPLDAIASTLHGKSAAELRAIASRKAPAAAPPVAAPAREAEAAHAPSGAPSGAALRGTRFVLAPGLELWLSDEADDPARQLADAVRVLAMKQVKRKGKG
jgi:DNA-binding transcriptional MerR regulator